MIVLLKYLTFIICIYQANVTPFTSDELAIHNVISCLLLCEDKQKPGDKKKCMKELPELMKTEECNFEWVGGKRLRNNLALHLDPADNKIEPKQTFLPDQSVESIASHDDEFDFNPIIIDRGCPIGSQGSNKTIDFKLIACVANTDHHEESIHHHHHDPHHHHHQPKVAIHDHKCHRKGKHLH